MRLWFRAYTEGKRGRKDHKTGVSEHTIMPKKVKHGLSSFENIYFTSIFLSCNYQKPYTKEFSLWLRKENSMWHHSRHIYYTIINSFVHLLLHVDHLRIQSDNGFSYSTQNGTTAPIKKIQNDWKVHFYIQKWYAIMDCTRTLSKEKSQRSCSSTEYLWNTFTYR